MIRGVRHRLRSLRSDLRGVAVIEFGIIAPVLCMFLMGIGDLLYTIYLKSILVGAVQKAGRDATIEGNNTATMVTTLDARVMRVVTKVAPNAVNYSIQQSFQSFSGIDKPEPYTDTPAKGTVGQYDAAFDCYTDLNKNNTYDVMNTGHRSIGGASDISRYTITITYPRIFPVAGFFGFGNQGTLVAQTVLKNQPYTDQTRVSPTCPT